MYVQTLYDEICEENKVDSSNQTKEEEIIIVCKPKHNSRLRSEALKGYIQLVGIRSNINEAHVENANLIGVDFKKATLLSARLDEAILVRTNLSESNLSSANLEGAILADANLSDANLSNASLIDADLTDAFLFRANLSDINLTRADLTRTELLSVLGLTCKALKTVLAS